MGLCGGFSLLLKRLELMLNEFFDDIFSEHRFFWFFREFYIRKIWIFFPMIFTIKKLILREKNRFFTKGGPETRESRVRRPGSLE